MENPWEEISLDDYEKHMALESVMQLQAMNEIMGSQLCRYPVATVMILGIAGGNGLNHVQTGKIKKVYGVDINRDYLAECVARYPGLKNIFLPVHGDLQDENITLPTAEILIANLLIEYVGYKNFQNAVKKAAPAYVSSVIQINKDDGFVSSSPYLHAFDRLGEVHYQVDRDGLTKAMQDIGFRPIYEAETALPNGKSLLRLDFHRQQQA